MVLEGGIYNSRYGDSYFVIVKKEKKYVFGFDIGYSIDYPILTRTQILSEIQDKLSDLETYMNASFWYVDEEESIVDGYLGRVDDGTLYTLQSELFYSDAYDIVGEN